MTRPLAGYGILLRHAIRLDRLRLPLWVVTIALLPAVTYQSYERLFATPGSRMNIASSLTANPALLLLYGAGRSLTAPGGFTAWRTGVFSCVFVAIVAILTVVRHTRAEEEAGRADLLGSTGAGRFALGAAGVSLAIMVCVASGAATTVGLMAVGAQLRGAACFGLLVSMTGVAFAGVAAVTCQIASFSRGASSAALAILALSYLVRAWGDATGTAWLSWLSPVSWIEKAAPFTVDTIDVTLLPLALSGILMTVAAVLLGRRDVGSGFMEPRSGPATSPRRLSGSFGLAWRLTAPSCILWLVSLATFGAVFGAAVRSLTQLFEKNTVLRGFLAHGPGSLTDLFVGEVLSILAVMASLVGVQIMLKARSEETSGRVEILLTTPLSRVRWFVSQLALALGAATLAIAVGGLALGLGASSTGATVSLSHVLASTAAQLPAVWVLVTVAAALVGAAPRWSAVALPVVAATFVIMLFGPSLDLPGIIEGLSVFAHVPKNPAQVIPVVPLVALCGISVALALTSLVGIKRRDIA